MASMQYNLFSGIISKLPLKLKLNILFFRRFGSFCNFEDPQTFNEKIQYKKIYVRTELMTITADKLLAKQYVKNLLPDIYIPKTLWEASHLDELDLLDVNKLPNDYVFKANHTSQTIEIIKNGEHLSKSTMRRRMSSWLKRDQSGALGEWAYENIKPKVFIEEFLDFEGSAPDDYKFFVYHGKVHFIQVDSDRFTDHKRNMYDRNWNDLDFDYSHRRKTPIPTKPFFINTMIEMAETIGQAFDFIRVDFYFYQDKITFGEITHYPGAGFEKFPNKNFDKLFGEPWCIKF